MTAKALIKKIGGKSIYTTIYVSKFSLKTEAIPKCFKFI